MARRPRRHDDDGHLVLVDARTGAVLQLVPGAMCEQLRGVLNRVGVGEGGAELPSRLGLIASYAGEGTGTLTRALGAVLGNDLGRRVCVVDLDFWSPFSVEGTRPAAGIVDVLAGAASLEQVLRHDRGLDVAVLPAGSARVADRPMLVRSEELRDLLGRLTERYDHLVLGLPALRVASDAITLAALADGLLLVVRQRVTTEADVRAALDELDGLPVLGAVLNRTSSPVPAFVRRLLPAP